VNILNMAQVPKATKAWFVKLKHLIGAKV